MFLFFFVSLPSLSNCVKDMTIPHWVVCGCMLLLTIVVSRFWIRVKMKRQKTNANMVVSENANTVNDTLTTQHATKDLSELTPIWTGEMRVDGKDIIIVDPVDFVLSTEVWETYWKDFAQNKSLDKLGCKNALCYAFGDVFHTVLVDDENKILDFIGSEDIIGCFLLDEVLAYNPAYAKEIEERHFGTIIPNYTGVITFRAYEIDKYGNMTSRGIIEGKGSINFRSVFEEELGDIIEYRNGWGPKKNRTTDVVLQ